MNIITIGLDIGGTKIMAAAANSDGQILRRVRADTPPGLDEGLALLQRLTLELQGADMITAIGAAVGGPLDWQTGVVSPLHQPEWRDVPLKAIFESKFGCPFFVDVDTNAAVMAEWRERNEETGSLLYLTLSTGMGGGFIREGALYRGKNKAHPEAAHQSVPMRVAHPERVECECGAPDCLEALVSGNGIQRVYGKRAEELTASEWNEVAYHLGLGLRNLATILAPDVIVLGGGVSVGGGDAFVAEARRVMESRLRLVPAPEVRLSRLGYDTALRGAIALAQSQ